MTNNIIYIGMTAATTFKERYANHTSSFRHNYKKDSNKTELSKHIWKLKENNQD
jgi:predicted GIY-YIG superfamily endonuclease